jgi:alpha-galactosidase
MMQAGTLILNPRQALARGSGARFVLRLGLAALTFLTGVLPGSAATAPRPPLARPDAKAPDQTRKVKVFILMGQSNMVGMGDINPDTKPGTLTTLTKTEKKYPFLVDDASKWTVRKDVYYYDARVKKGSPLSPTSNNGKSIGPELGFGYVMGHVLDEPVLILKSCIGNRSLGWDLLPPGSERYEAEVIERGQKVTKVFAGYKDSPDSWVKGAEPKRIAWYAGKQYDDDMANAKAALENLANIYPDYRGQGYEITGFVWWQGHKDQNPVHASRYEQNLVRLIQCLRKDYNAPNAKFVLATGCGNPGREGFGLQIAEAQLAVGDARKHPEFAGNVNAVDSRDLWREVDVSPKSQGYHYNRNAETFMEVGLRLGWAIADLLQNEK